MTKIESRSENQSEMRHTKMVFQEGHNMTEIAKVIVVPCDSYEKEQVYAAVKTGVEALGGMEEFIGKSEKILVKPNFLSAALPEKAVTTHPAVIEAVFRILQEEGYLHVQYGDSPGHGSCQAAAGKIGLKEIAEQYGVKRANMEEEVLTSFPEGKTAKEFHFAKGITEADAIVNVCKMKTHALERVTGAVKNVYGFICGARKAAGHVKYPNASVFARALADIHRCTDIRLHIMDGITAMEGNGPGSGTPLNMNVLLFSTDPVALDTVFCHMVYLDPQLVPTCVQGMAMGIGTYKEEEIQITEVVISSEKNSADEVSSETVRSRDLTMEEMQKKYGNPDFDVDRVGRKRTFLSRYSDFMTRLARRPVIDREKCVKCGICVSHCPVPGKAVNFKKGKGQPPVYDYKKCIRCYCCQEMCPKHAIKVK